MRKQDALQRSLSRYYTPANRRRLAAIVGRKSAVSLRIIDWLTTNYAKKYNIVYLHNGQPFNIFLEYKACLRSFSKKFFDPFARRERMQFDDGNGGQITTTLAQQNFFRWAMGSGVVDYALANVDQIEADMNSAIQHRYKEEKMSKRKELSKAAVRSCTKTNVNVVVRFS